MYKEILKLRRTGLTYEEVGKRYGLSRERIRQIVHKQTRIENILLRKTLVCLQNVCGRLRRSLFNTHPILAPLDKLKKCKHGSYSFCTKCAYMNTGRRKSTDTQLEVDCVDFMNQGINKRLRNGGSI